MPLILPASRDSRYNTLHFTSQSRVPNGALPPLEPPQEKEICYPSMGRIPPFLVIQSSDCIGWAKVSVGMVWYLYLSEPSVSHFETVCLLTPSFSATSSWVSPHFSLRGINYFLDSSLCLLIHLWPYYTVWYRPSLPTIVIRYARFVCFGSASSAMLSRLIL